MSIKPHAKSSRYSETYGPVKAIGAALRAPAVRGWQECPKGAPARSQLQRKSVKKGA